MTTQLFRAGTSVLTMPDADAGYTETWVHHGTAQRTLDGTLRKHQTALKRNWVVRWSHLNSANRNTLVTELSYDVAMKFKAPDQVVIYDVLTLDFLVEPTEFGWTITATFEEI